MALDEASLASSHTGRPGHDVHPRVEHLGVRARVGPQPLKKIEERAVEVIRHSKSLESSPEPRPAQERGIAGELRQ
jgi:hypothetical protein